MHFKESIDVAGGRKAHPSEEILQNLRFDLYKWKSNLEKA